jgi:hypothetical protein
MSVDEVAVTTSSQKELNKSMLDAVEDEDDDDITEDGEENRDKPPESSQRRFLFEMYEYPKEWENLYNDTICAQGVFPVCQGQIEEQLDLITVRTRQLQLKKRLLFYLHYYLPLYLLRLSNFEL